MTADRDSGRSRRRAGPLAILAAVLAALAAVAAGAVLGRPAPRTGFQAAAAVATSSAPVVRADLTNTIQVAGRSATRVPARSSTRPPGRRSPRRPPPGPWYGEARPST